MKNKIKNICWTAGLALALVSCNDSFLNRQPFEDMTDGIFWKTANDLKVYNNGIYNEAGNNSYYSFLVGHSNGGYNSSYMSAMGMEAQTDNVASLVSTQAVYSQVAAGLENIPSGQTRGGWYWTFLRRCNVFFENYQQAEIDEETKNRYAGEVHFFRAWFYLDKVQNYGDVPLITHALIEESPELYEPQSPRKEVMALVLEDINKAIEYLPETWDSDHPDRVDKYTALALKSRICLYEGTYNKYHNLGEYESWLKEAADAAEKVMNANKYQIYNTGNPGQDYRTLFTTPDLHGNPEVIMCRTYSTPGMAHRVSGYIVTQSYGPTKDFVDDFLCIEPDGTAKPVALSSVFSDDTYTQVFDNRDPRLTQIVLDPRQEAAIMHTEKGYPFIKGMGVSWESSTGYHFIKYYEYDDDMRGFDQEINDYPLFRYAEVLLNYAEAKAELGTITQADLDKTINQLRERVNMPHLDLNPPMDPKYAGEGISSLLVEIRRERRIELSFELFRYQDLMRWKQGGKLAERYLGMRLEDEDRQEGKQFASTTAVTFELNGKKYIDAYAGTDYAFERRVFNENKHYLHPIPINVMAKNPQLVQNPGWE